MVVRSGGIFPLDAAGSAALTRFKPNALINVKISRRRSLPHHNFFFAFLSEVFQNWPAVDPRGNAMPIYPDSAEHLRAWLIVKAKWIDYIEFQVASREEAIAMGNILHALFLADRAKGFYKWVKWEGSIIKIASPKTIRMEEMDEAAFTSLSEKVFGLIEDYTGIKVDESKARWETEIRDGKRKRRKTTGMADNTEAESCIP